MSSPALAIQLSAEMRLLQTLFIRMRHVLTRGALFPAQDRLQNVCASAAWIRSTATTVFRSARGRQEP
jgi:hypothetical protein